MGSVLGQQVLGQLRPQAPQVMASPQWVVDQSPGDWGRIRMWLWGDRFRTYSWSRAQDYWIKTLDLSLVARALHSILKIEPFRQSFCDL